MKNLLMFAFVLCQACAVAVVPEDSRVEKVASGYKFTEGPAADRDGNVWFTDIPNKRILKFDVTSDEATVVREKSGGANGLMFDKDGRLFVCEGGSRRLTYEDGSILADRYDGKKLNSPNDLDIDRKGGVYFTDPRYGKRRNMELDVEAVYYVSPKGKLIRVIDDLKRPNGLILSKDAKILYVADNAAKKIVAYDVRDDGSLWNARDFAWMDKEARGGPDGMTLDERGNVYAAAQGAIWIWTPEGKLDAKIKVPENPSNCAFSGQTLYITARKSLYRIKLNVSGR